MEFGTVKILNQKLTARLSRLLGPSLMYPRSERLPGEPGEVRLIRDESLRGFAEAGPLERPAEEGESALRSVPDPLQLRSENIFAMDLVRVRSLEEFSSPRKLK